MVLPELSPAEGDSLEEPAGALAAGLSFAADSSDGAQPARVRAATTATAASARGMRGLLGSKLVTLSQNPTLLSVSSRRAEVRTSVPITWGADRPAESSAEEGTRMSE